MKNEVNKAYLEDFLTNKEFSIKNKIRTYMADILWIKTTNEHDVAVESRLMAFSEFDKLNLIELISDFFNNGATGGRIKKDLYRYLSSFNIESTRKKLYFDCFKELVLTDFDYEVVICFNKEFMGQQFRLETIPEDRLNFTYSENKTRFKNEVKNIKKTMSETPASDRQLQYLESLLVQHDYVLKKDKSELNSSEASSLISFFVNDRTMSVEEKKLITYK